jgi:hypothetical protein
MLNLALDRYCVETGQTKNGLIADLLEKHLLAEQERLKIDLFRAASMQQA